jgi:hypothetical protein
MPSIGPSLPNIINRGNRNYLKQIQNFTLWPPLAAEFGEEKALELLKQCKAEIK